MKSGIKAPLKPGTSRHDAWETFTISSMVSKQFS